jgi:hypothetical protein
VVLASVVILYFGPHWKIWPNFCPSQDRLYVWKFRLLSAGRIYFFWPSPAQSFLVSSPTGLMPIIYFLTTPLADVLGREYTLLCATCLTRILFWRSQKEICESSRTQLCVSEHQKQLQMFLKLQCRFFRAGVLAFNGNVYVSFLFCSAVLQLPAHAGSSPADFSTLKMETIRSSETSVQSITSTRCHTPEDGILHSHRRENLKSYIFV